ncbi:uncharacterized protein LOC115678060 isoform X1 [Syzygium oleosum]|uniref:uncharacterized protein LOC115678060 isoform X1 n=1 Tax=Syzygium oleosum TaxID=219896 RepID=UPI0024BA9E45|nr:uncharacterized protein LOC115678060 isoform X1 [Syzygium oleosum]XP_056169178.1 uncharacterized protein LOC115678060 isoform X1 [Syzygium oleosum]
MPSASPSASSGRPADLVSRLASSDRDVRLRALREVKNQIIGNRTKKLAYIKLGAVPAVAAALAGASDGPGPGEACDLLVQSAAALGSFACGVDAGVQAVVDAGALPRLRRLLSSPDEKVVDSGARSLKMIYQSRLAPKYDFLDHHNLEFLLSLLNSKNENVTGLGASIITHSCQTSTEQRALHEAGVVQKLVEFIAGSVSQRDPSLESLTAIIKNNHEVTSKIVEFENGRALNLINKFTIDKSPRTRLLACACLIAVSKTSSRYVEDMGLEIKLIHHLLELLEDPGQVGDEASFALSSLIEEKEDLQKLALEANAINKLCIHLQNGLSCPKRLQGILLALANICSKLEICRSKLLALQAFNLVSDALRHDCTNVRVAACICLRSLSRSVKNLSAGYFMNETVIIPLLQLLHDPSISAQRAALGAISNIVVDFTKHKSNFIHCGGVKQLVELSMAMDPVVRSHSLWALKNLTFLADSKYKEVVLSELTASSLASLIRDPESAVQEQALALVRNLVDGCLQSIEYVFAENGIILDAMGRQLQYAAKAEIGIQGMYALSNVASGSKVHKDAVMEQLFQHGGMNTQPFIVRFLHSNENQLRTASVWVLLNLTTFCPGAAGRVLKLRNAGIVSQLKSMANDPCLDVKLRVRTTLSQMHELW